jgi:putative Mg2+ transporter-C (MgtC) family protein
MLSIFDGLRQLNMYSAAFRLFLAVICGGIIGLEREFKRRPAGFRTHILICLGAAMTTLTSQFLYLYMHYYTDMARLGAQVIAGIGFIGAGTIITRRERIKGLTTAAGLWTAAIVGLAIGGGFYEGALITTGLVELAELVFARIDFALLKHSPEVNLYIEYEKREALDSVFTYFREQEIRLIDLEITHSKATSKHNACAILSVRMNRHVSVDEMMVQLKSIKEIILIEEI